MTEKKVMKRKKEQKSKKTVLKRKSVRKPNEKVKPKSALGSKPKNTWSVNLKGGVTHEVPKGKAITLNGHKHTEESYKKTVGHIIGSQAVKAKRSVDKQIHEKYTSKPSFTKGLRAEQKQAKDKDSRTTELSKIWHSQRTKGNTGKAIEDFKKKHGKKSMEYLKEYLRYRKDKQERRNLGLIPSKIVS